MQMMRTLILLQTLDSANEDESAEKSAWQQISENISKQGKEIKISRIRFNTPQINQRNGSWYFQTSYQNFQQIHGRKEVTQNLENS